MNRNRLFAILVSFGFLLIIVMISISRFNSSTLKPIKIKESGRISIVTTIFPIYDWVKNIVGDTDAEVHLLSKPGVDIHSFQPSVADIVKIVDSDVFIYVGGESDMWIQDALKNIDRDKTAAIDCIKTLASRAKKEELIEGMQGEEEDTVDEHIWLSIKNAYIIVKKIADEMCSKDKRNAQAYKSNAEKYLEKLENMDKMYSLSTGQYSDKVVVFADKFPFRYLMDDYGIKCYAAFPGCSSESKASFETIKFLSRKIDENHISVILKIEDTPKDLSYSVKNNTFYQNQEILTLDSMQSTMHKRSAKNDYLDIMYSNLDIIEKALSTIKKPKENVELL